LEFIQPGKPTQNSFIERFNRIFRDDVLYFYIFSSLNEVRKITENWLKQHNEQRSHESLGDLTPSEYLAIKSPELSTFDWHSRGEVYNGPRIRTTRNEGTTRLN
jgi:putative transposase